MEKNSILTIRRTRTSVSIFKKDIFIKIRSYYTQWCMTRKKLVTLYIIRASHQPYLFSHTKIEFHFHIETKIIILQPFLQIYHDQNAESHRIYTFMERFVITCDRFSSFYIQQDIKKYINRRVVCSFRGSEECMRRAGATTQLHCMAKGSLCTLPDVLELFLLSGSYRN